MNANPKNIIAVLVLVLCVVFMAINGAPDIELGLIAALSVAVLFTAPLP